MITCEGCNTCYIIARGQKLETLFFCVMLLDAHGGKSFFCNPGCYSSFKRREWIGGVADERGCKISDVYAMIAADYVRVPAFPVHKEAVGLWRQRTANAPDLNRFIKPTEAEELQPQDDTNEADNAPAPRTTEVPMKAILEAASSPPVSGPGPALGSTSSTGLWADESDDE